MGHIPEFSELHCVVGIGVCSTEAYNWLIISCGQVYSLYAVMLQCLSMICLSTVSAQVQSSAVSICNCRLLVNNSEKHFEICEYCRLLKNSMNIFTFM